MTSYSDFLAAKAQLANAGGFEPDTLPGHLFDFQAFLVEWATRQGRAGLFADCGLGKTPMELAVADQWHRRTGKPVLLLTPLAVSFQIVSEAHKFGHDADLSRTGKPAAPITVTNYEQLDKFNSDDFAGVVCDECFAPGTLVDTPSGAVPIESLRIGDLVNCALGVSTIWDVHRRKVPYAVIVKARGREVICSPNHPWLTHRGWVCAQDLEPGDSLVDQAEAVRMVQGAVREEVGDSTPQGAFLRALLLSEVADGPARVCGEVAHAGDRREAWGASRGVSQVGVAGGSTGTRADSDTQPNGSARGAREGLPPIEGDEPSTFRAWRQWEGPDGTATDDEGNTWRAVAGGAVCVSGPIDSRVSHALQTRLGERRDASRYRTGWELASLPEGARPEEGREAGFSRVDCLEILEPGDSRLDRLRDADGFLCFYDLGVEGHPSFSVNGHLVHNSSILKSFDGVTRAQVTEFMRRLPYRLLATATAAPNDWTELGTSSEALGGLGYMDMLTRFFTNKLRTTSSRGRGMGGESVQWRLKGHAEHPFWRWVATWARAMRKPSDFGFSDARFHLPALDVRQTIVEGREDHPDQLFSTPAVGLREEREENRRTLTERCEAAAEALSGAESGVAWCHLNDESALLARLIPGAVEVSGADSADEKEAKLAGFSDGSIRFLVTKPSIGAWGLNWQHSHRMTYFASHSYEQWYQSIRRMWRFGQTQPVRVDVIASEGGKNILANLQRKADQADAMFTALVAHMNDALAVERHQYNNRLELPTWLAS